MEAEEKKESKGWFWSLISRGSVGDVDILSTHPASGKRVKTMETQIPEALAIRAASSACAHTLGPEFNEFRMTAFGA
ncbi:uncharacterized protein EI90DRAFT_3047968 [Cantharellus anzutake]|uniref:uncharacterized protein n=1 Tax=Cantharellus anzutake TaxID=1750568 RepID=UPI0019048105|nr:uncharacterized protein EI90DRAFT_3047968 [Cantharellus anzutake]KAF8335337.1 hypothetical protein EI90DRAFT_3047968 [Cantharellus anzutake]